MLQTLSYILTGIIALSIFRDCQKIRQPLIGVILALATIWQPWLALAYFIFKPTLLRKLYKHPKDNTETPATSRLNLCPKCGHQNTPTAKKCSECDNQLQL